MIELVKRFLGIVSPSKMHYNMYQKIRRQRFINEISHFTCYNEQEANGNAIFGMCGGVMGGSSLTEYLDEKCLDCAFFVHFE